MLGLAVRIGLGAQWRTLGSAPFLGGFATLLGTLAIIGKVAAAAFVFFNVTAVGDPIDAQWFDVITGEAVNPAALSVGAKSYISLQTR